LIVYFDSSALVKMTLDEEGSDLAGELWDAASSRMASQIGYPEVRAALSAAQRDGRIDPGGLEQAIADFEGLFAAMRLLDVDGELCWRAGELAERHALRGYDAVHLAAVVGVDSPRVVVATWDRDLGAAASEHGLGVVPSPRSSGSDERAGA